jgi:hypothetical protein
MPYILYTYILNGLSDNLGQHLHRLFLWAFGEGEHFHETGRWEGQSFFILSFKGVTFSISQAF